MVEKALGNNDHARGAVIREETGRPQDRPKLTTDNSLVGALRRAGVLGVAAFLGGLALLIYHAFRRGTPAWLMIAAVASPSTMATSDWLLGGSGGTLWVFLLTAGGVGKGVRARPGLLPTTPAPESATR